MAAGVTIDKTDLFSVKNSLDTIKKGVPDAIRFATNDSLSALKTATSREIRNKVTAKLKPVNKTLTIKKMFPLDMSANLTCTGKPLPLVDYKYVATVKGTKVQVLKAGVAKIIKHSFLATMKSGHKGIFWREEKKEGKGIWPEGKRMKLPPPFYTGKYAFNPLRKFQLPIIELYGPRVPDVMDDDEVMRPILQEASDRYDARLEHHTERLLDKARAV